MLGFDVCSLLVELTVVPSTSTSGEELFHQSTEEAYESGIHAVRSSEGQKTLWKEYIFYLRSKADSKDKEDFLRLVDGVHRCLLDVDCYDRAIPLDSQCVDYSFHNEVRLAFLLKFIWLQLYLLILLDVGSCYKLLAFIIFIQI